jgi:hypothetical protein
MSEIGGQSELRALRNRRSLTNKRGICRAATNERAGKKKGALPSNQGVIDLAGVFQADIRRTVKAYRRERRKPELTVVAEAVEPTG